MKTDELFLRFLNDIQTQVSDTTYNIWFSKLELLSIVNNVVTIKVPMEVHKQMLSGTYKDIISNSFFAMTGIYYTFKFITDDEVENFVEPVVPEESVGKEVEWNTNLNPKFTFDNYVVGNSNRLAFVSARAVAEAPGTIHNPLFIYGRSGIGKTHLMQAIGNYIKDHSKLKVLYTTSNEFRDEFTGIATSNNKMGYANDFKDKYRSVDVLIIDDIQFLVEAEKTQQEFFHTFNALHQANKQIIISSDKSPDDLKKIEERLRSRFMWGLPVDIYPPDFELRVAILKKRIAGEAINKYIPDQVIEYMASNLGSDIRMLEGSVTRLVAYSTIMGSEIDLNLAMEALKDYINKGISEKNDINKIQKVVAEYFKISIDDLKSKKRNSNISFPRQIAMYLCRKLTDESFPKIGIEFGGKDHSTVMHSCEKIEKEISTNKDLNKTIEILEKEIK